MKRGNLIRCKREHLERLARFLRLKFEVHWSSRYFGSLVYWRITRRTDSRH